MVRKYEPGREDHEFDPKLGNFFLSTQKISCCNNFVIIVDSSFVLFFGKKATQMR